ncbi:fatty acyl-AMP ligase [Roseomonas sp. SSH11]|uniref:Fatty acyl-AMP ligase n=1 Tax=Pararoseomonas baculiformis TaxID=2820812 RepID=A0ABS4ADV5_9PROT|nr:fatty acyl-AMP ligase [Pararoseomonas baculiformis]MBP0445061.1 fatty acyl-AMP ligase [Pararoseomonas baculiformis]
MSGQDPSAGTMVGVLRDHALRWPDRPAMTFLARGETPADGLTYAELDNAARRVAARLMGGGLAGQSVLLACPPGLDFIRLFMGCLYAGVYAVPVPAVWRRQGGDRIRAIAASARPSAILSNERPEDEAVLAMLRPARGGGFIPAAEALAASPAAIEEPEPDSPAFIQYTSGSTSTPKGVVVTHRNIMANQRMISAAFAHDADTVVVSWLPLHHDMGLIGSILQPLFLCGRCVLFSPVDFLQRPARWLRAISHHGATTSGAPNFAYEMCARHVTDAQLAGVDLSRWKLAFCGSEPVRPRTMERFAARFAHAGFRPEALYPCYGLAEATLFVAGPQACSGVEARSFERAGFADLTTNASAHQPAVSCGHAWDPSSIAVIDRVTRQPLPEGRIGEICVAGPHVSPGLWAPGAAGNLQPYGERLVRIDGTSYLRTGDAGVVEDNRLFVVGRLKDMIILRGANIYAEDVERTVMEQPAAADFAAAAVVAVEGAEKEEMVVLCELERGVARAGLPAGIAAGLRSRIAEAHGFQPAAIHLVASGALPRTTSGKVQRGAARAALLDHRLSLVPWT